MARDVGSRSEQLELAAGETHGDVIQRIRDSGEATPTYRYDAFGNQKPRGFVQATGLGETDPNPFRYCGEYFDSETGEVYLRTRYYDTATGRFGREDPAKDGNGWYNYCDGNPVGQIDPSGLAAKAVPSKEKVHTRNSNVKALPSTTKNVCSIVGVGVGAIGGATTVAEATGYDRDAAVEYALSLGVMDSGEAALYPGRFGNDCTNFVSNTLFYGGGLEQTDEWYFHWLPSFNGKYFGSQVGLEMGLYSRSWSMAQDQYQWIINSEYINGDPIPVNIDSNLSDIISDNNVQKGDLLYWDYDNDGTIDHASIIVDVTDGQITYAQHTTDKIDGDLQTALTGTPTTVQIVRIRD